MSSASPTAAAASKPPPGAGAATLIPTPFAGLAPRRPRLGGADLVLATGPIAAADAGPVATTDSAGAIATADLTGKRGHATGAGRAIPAADSARAIATADLTGKRGHATRAGRAIPAANAAGPIGTDSAARLRKGRLRRDPTEARPITAAADLAREGRGSTRATRPVSTTDPAGAVTAANLTWQRCGTAGASPTTESAGTISTSPRADLPRKRRRPAEPTGSVAPQATGASPLPRAADLAGAKRRSGPIRKAATRPARRAAAKLAGKRGRAPEPARAPAELPPRTVGPIEPAEISGLRRGAIEPTEIPGLRGRPRHPSAADAPHAGPADAAAELAGLRRRPVGGAWE